MQAQSHSDSGAGDGEKNAGCWAGSSSSSKNTSHMPQLIYPISWFTAAWYILYTASAI